MESQLLIDARSAAKQLSISEKTLWKRTKEGLIPCVRIGNRVLYSVDRLKTWIESQEE